MLSNERTPIEDTRARVKQAPKKLEVPRGSLMVRIQNDFCPPAKPSPLRSSPHSVQPTAQPLPPSSTSSVPLTANVSSSSSHMVEVHPQGSNSYIREERRPMDCHSGRGASLDSSPERNHQYPHKNSEYQGLDDRQEEGGPYQRRPRRPNKHLAPTNWRAPQHYSEDPRYVSTETYQHHQNKHTDAHIGSAIPDNPSYRDGYHSPEQEAAYDPDGRWRRPANSQRDVATSSAQWESVTNGNIPSGYPEKVESYPDMVMHKKTTSLGGFSRTVANSETLVEPNEYFASQTDYGVTQPPLMYDRRNEPNYQPLQPPQPDFIHPTELVGPTVSPPRTDSHYSYGRKEGEDMTVEELVKETTSLDDPYAATNVDGNPLGVASTAAAPKNVPHNPLPFKNVHGSENSTPDKAFRRVPASKFSPPTGTVSYHPPELKAVKPAGGPQSIPTKTAPLKDETYFGDLLMNDGYNQKTIQEPNREAFNDFQSGPPQPYPTVPPDYGQMGPPQSDAPFAGSTMHTPYNIPQNPGASPFGPPFGLNSIPMAPFGGPPMMGPDPRAYLMNQFGFGFPRFPLPPPPGYSWPPLLTPAQLQARSSVEDAGPQDGGNQVQPGENMPPPPQYDPTRSGSSHSDAFLPSYIQHQQHQHYPPPNGYMNPLMMIHPARKMATPWPQQGYFPQGAAGGDGFPPNMMM